MTDHRAWVHLHAEGTRRRNRGEEQRVAFIRGMDSVTRSFLREKHMTTTPRAGLRQWQEAECHFLVSK